MSRNLAFDCWCIMYITVWMSVGAFPITQLEQARASRWQMHHSCCIIAVLPSSMCSFCFFFSFTLTQFFLSVNTEAPSDARHQSDRRSSLSLPISFLSMLTMEWHHSLHYCGVQKDLNRWKLCLNLRIRYVLDKNDQLFFYGNFTSSERIEQ